MKATNSFAALLILMIFAAPVHAAVLNFESINGATPFEGMAISNQFQAQFGISFRRDDGEFPAIARKGFPEAVFHVTSVTPTLSDMLKAADPRANDFGDYFLADDVDPSTTHTIIMDFAAPVNHAGGYIFDIDGTERVTLTAYSDDGTNSIGEIILTKNSPEAGEGASTPWSFTHATNDIRQIRFTAGAYGFDNIESSYTPPPQQQATLDVHFYAGLLIQGDVGRPYRIDYADQLTPTNWIEQTNLFLPSSPFLYFDVTSTNASRRFYRAVGLP